MKSNSDFERMFDPQSVAFIGVSGKTSDGKYSFMSAGTGFMVRLLDRGFKGRVYPINPKLDEILGMKVYANLTDLPEPADLAIVAVPASVIPSVLEDCIVAGTRNVVLFTAGFEETGEEEGKRLAEQTRGTE